MQIPGKPGGIPARPGEYRVDAAGRNLPGLALPGVAKRPGQAGHGIFGCSAILLATVGRWSRTRTSPLDPARARPVFTFHTTGLRARLSYPGGRHGLLVKAVGARFARPSRRNRLCGPRAEGRIRHPARLVEFVWARSNRTALRSPSQSFNAFVPSRAMNLLVLSFQMTFGKAPPEKT